MYLHGDSVPIGQDPVIKYSPPVLAVEESEIAPEGESGVAWSAFASAGFDAGALPGFRAEISLLALLSLVAI